MFSPFNGASLFPRATLFPIIVVTLLHPLSWLTKVALSVVYRGWGGGYFHGWLKAITSVFYFYFPKSCLPVFPNFSSMPSDTLMSSGLFPVFLPFFSSSPPQHTHLWPPPPPLFLYMSLGAISPLKAAHTVLWQPHTNAQPCVGYLL